MLEKVTDFAIAKFDRSNHLADPTHNQGYYGVPQEWYTLAENLFRAYQLTGNPKFKTFAEAWLYPAYWNKFASQLVARRRARRSCVQPRQHVQQRGDGLRGERRSFVSAHPAQRVRLPAADTVLRDRRLRTRTSDSWRRTAAWAARSTRGRIPLRPSCGSWAGFKLARYLMRFTGEAQYGDWIERLLYNGVGAALPLQPDGRNFYYADYRVGGGMKVYNWDTFTCCSGTYIQNTADYHNLIYFKDATGLYVNLYLPSEVTWEVRGSSAKVVLETAYPETETSSLTLTLAQPTRLALRFRVPQWTRGMTLAVNGQSAGAECRPGSWATIEREWKSGDRVEVKVPLTLRMEAVDREHPDRVAVVRGPVVLVLEGAYHAWHFRLPDGDDDLVKWLVPEKWTPPLAILTETGETRDSMAVFRVVPPDGSPVRLKFRPFYDVGENYPYFIYFDRRGLPYRLW